MKKKGIVALSLVLALSMTACDSGKKNESNTSQSSSSSQDTQDTQSGSATGSIVESTWTETVTQSTSDLFSDRDYETTYDESQCAVITLNGSTATCSSDAVTIDGGTITIKDEGTYILRGTLEDGMIIVNAGDSDKTQLVLDGVDITSSESAPIYVYEADKVFITLAEGSENTLTNGGTFTAIDENDIDSVIFSKSDLTLNGNGSLTISSPAGHGVVSKDELTITGGTYAISCASSGFNANDNVCIDGGAYTIASGKDGIHCENSEDTSLGFVYIEKGTFDITAEGDGISASGYMEINDGTYNILAGGGSENGASQSSDSWGDMPGGGGGGMMPGGGGDMPGGGGGGMGPGGGGGMRSAETVDVTVEGLETVVDSTANSTMTTETTDESTSMKGIKSDGILYINGGTFTIDSADDGVHSNTSIVMSEGVFDIATGDDGFHAEEELNISGGTITITESYEGLEALNVVISGGDIDMVASDDGINAAGGTDQSGFGGRDDGGFGGMGQGGMNSGIGGSIVISGGTINMQASGDGIDSNGTLEITGGTTTVCGPTNGDTAVLDYETSGAIEGGTFVGTGASMMALSLDSDNQGVLPISVGSQSAGSEIVVTDSQGNVVLSHTPELQYQIFIYSSPEIVKGETYTITIGDVSGEVEAE